MSLETDLQEGIRQHALSRELWQQQSVLHEQKRAQLEQSIADYLTTARSEYPILRLSKNQILNGESGAPPTYWGAHPNCSFEKICTVLGALQQSSRHPESLDLLETLKIPSRERYIGTPFNIWRMRWTTGTMFTMYQYAHMSNRLSGSFAYTKLETGAISGHWAHGITKEWSLTGQYYGGGNAGDYTMCHPYPDDSEGSLLFALPAVVIGKKAVADNVWGLFPYLGDTQYD